MAVKFVDGPEFCLVLAQLDAEGNILTKFQNNPTSGLGGDAITKNVYSWTEQTDAGEFPDRQKSSSGLRPEELLSKRALKRAFKFR